MKKRIYYAILLVIFLTGGSFFLAEFSGALFSKGIISYVSAEDDDDEEDEEDEEDDDEESDSEEKTEATYVKLPDQIIKRLITSTIYDSDGDGIFDPEDATPNMHNVFIVEDNNLNGIADDYENE